MPKRTIPGTGGRMWVKRASLVAAATSWGALAVDGLTPWVGFPPRVWMVLLSVAICATNAMLYGRHQRSTEAVYDLGYQAGMRAGMTTAQARGQRVIPLHRVVR